MSASSANKTLQNGSTIIDLNDGDTIRLSVFQTSGGNLDFSSGTGEGASRITIIKLLAPV